MYSVCVVYVYYVCLIADSTFPDSKQISFLLLHYKTPSLTQSPLRCSAHHRCPTYVLKHLVYQLPRRRRTLHVFITPHLLSNPIRFLGVDNPIRIIFRS